MFAYNVLVGRIQYRLDLLHPWLLMIEEGTRKKRLYGVLAKLEAKPSRMVKLVFVQRNLLKRQTYFITVQAGRKAILQVDPQ